MKVAITGADGKVGQALIGQLDPERFEVTALDLTTGFDATNYDAFVAATAGHDALVHLAWAGVSKEGLENVDPRNRVMYENAYRAAVANGIGLVVMGSSNHARSHEEEHRESDGRIRYTGKPEKPNNAYGAEKQLMEKLGEQYAEEHSLKVIELRIGNINEKDAPLSATPTRWMSHRDFGHMMTQILEHDFKPGHFEVVYGVSDQPVFDWTNSFGFVPQDTAIVA